MGCAESKLVHEKYLKVYRICNHIGVKSLRKLKLQVQISIDGYIAGPNGEMDWMVWNWDDKLKNYVFEITESVDTIILGRKMTDGFVSY